MVAESIETAATAEPCQDVNERVHALIADIHKKRRLAENKTDPYLLVAWELAEADRNRVKHKEALEIAEIMVVEEREYLAHYEAKYEAARHRLALIGHAAFDGS